MTREPTFSWQKQWCQWYKSCVMKTSSHVPPLPFRLPAIRLRESRDQLTRSQLWTSGRLHRTSTTHSLQDQLTRSQLWPSGRLHQTATTHSLQDQLTRPQLWPSSRLHQTLHTVYKISWPVPSCDPAAGSTRQPLHTVYKISWPVPSCDPAAGSTRQPLNSFWSRPEVTYIWVALNGSYFRKLSKYIFFSENYIN